MANIIALFSIAILLQFVNSVPLMLVPTQNVKRRHTTHKSATQCDSDCQENITVSKNLRLKEQFQNPTNNVVRDEEQVPFREEELLRVLPKRPVFVVPREEQPSYVAPRVEQPSQPPVLVVPVRKPEETPLAYVVPIQEAQFSIQGPQRFFRTPRMVSSTVLAYLPVADVPLYRTFIHGFDSLKDSVNIEDSGSNTVKRDATDDFMEQLAHDAIMPNILPTMQIPELRSAGYGDSQVSVQAVYPDLQGSSSKSTCAVPLLFGCSPRVVIGALARKVSSHGTSAVPAY